MPWKNGGGSTLELHVHQPHPDGFDWRVSIAAVKADGPFSRFPGYDRHIMAIDGDGFRLDGGPDGAIAVAPLFTPRSFPGDWEISAGLYGSPTRDFNLIARRDTFESRLTCVTGARTLQLGVLTGWTFGYVLTGTIMLHDQHLHAGESFLLDPGETAHASLADPGVRIAVCEVEWRREI